jgi:hypothetical protein
VVTLLTTEEVASFVFLATEVNKSEIAFVLSSAEGYHKIVTRYLELWGERKSWVEARSLFVGKPARMCHRLRIGKNSIQ